MCTKKCCVNAQRTNQKTAFEQDVKLLQALFETELIADGTEKLTMGL
jgi:hypothetical protein